MKKRVVILANSYINRGRRSIAGKDTDTWKWIRFVIDREDNLSNSNKLEPQQLEPLRIYDIEFVEPAPLKHQPENHIISAEICPQESSSVDRHEVGKYLDTPHDLWLDNTTRITNEKQTGWMDDDSMDNTFDGDNGPSVTDIAYTFKNRGSSNRSHGICADKVPYNLNGESSEILQSLYLVKVQDLTCSYEYYDFGGKRISRWQAYFKYNAEDYRLIITDDKFTKNLDTKKKYPIKISNHLVISLSDPYQGFCYKLVAAIL